MKKFMIICAPVTSRSGYGDHARDLVWSLINHDKYDIKIMDVRWGDCPRNALKYKNSNDKKIIDCILKPNEQVKQQPDIYVDIRIPNEFQTIGKFNIGITAGVETDIVSGKWLEGCNKMDLVIVPSKHSKQGFINSVYDKVQDGPDGKKQKVGELKLEKPMEVLFEGANEEIYKQLDSNDIDSDLYKSINDSIKEDFAFLFLGQWVKGGYGEDRKDISRMLKVFYESFANKKKQPAMILKTSGATFSVMDQEDMLSKIKLVKDRFPSDWKFPKVYLLHGDLTDEEINELYNHPKVKAMVSFTHGEGFGRPLLEATMAGLPIIASDWSGQTDFLSNSDSIMIPGKINKVPKAASWKDIIVEESKWFTVDEGSAYKALNYCFSNQDESKNKAKNLMKINRSKFTLRDMEKAFDDILSRHMRDVPQQIGLKLPKLKKV